MHTSVRGFCDVESMELEDGDGGISPPPPYTGHDQPINKTKDKWMSSVKTVSGEMSSDKEKKMCEDLVAYWEQQSSWKSFTDNTTFHGVKHIFDDSPFKLRRILWILSFLAAVLFFVIQVGIRMADYYKYNTNVNVEVQYVSSLNFPAVTICNQNSFRMTKVVGDDMYYFVDDVFASSIDDIDFVKYKMYDSMNTTQFLNNAAHQIENLIDGCFWNAQPCNVATDFKKVITDMGVCYTFNYDSSNLKMAEESGASYGLRLILNVEQYEAMRGPQNDAGLKLLLHTPNEFPAVRDLGFSVAPGTHTLVAVYTKQVNGLEPPWGLCSNSAKPMSTCKMECKSKMVKKKCDCLDAYMDSEDVCSLTSLWGCVRNVTEKIKPSGDKCNCIVPCTRNVYEPRLSYAQLSRINIDRMVLKTADKTLKVQTTFENALETLQRVDKTILKKDEESIEYVTEKFAGLFDKTSNANTIYGSNSTIENSMEEAIDAIKNDKSIVKELEDHFEDLAESLEPDKVDLAMYILHYLEKQISGDSLDEGLHKDIMCASMITLQLPLEDKTDPDHILNSYLSGMSRQGWSPSQAMDHPSNDTMMDPAILECNNIIKERLQMAQQFYHLLVNVYNHSMGFLNNYQGLIDTIYTGSGRDPNTLPEHHECITFTNESYVPEFVNALWQLVEVIDMMRKSPNNAVVQQSLIGLSTVINTTEVYDYENWLKDLKKKCFWVNDMVDSDSFEDDLESGEEYLEYAAITLGKASTELTVTVQEELEALSELVTETVAVYINETRQYSEGAITKLTLAASFTSMAAGTTFSELIDTGNDIKGEIAQYIRNIEDVEAGLKFAFKKLFKSKLPVLKQDIINRMRIFEVVKTMDKSKAEPLINTMITTEDHNIDDIFKIMKEFFSGPEEYKNDAIGSTISALTTSVSKLQSRLRTYQSSSEMDQDFLLNNFLQVDIFYPDLSYDIIKQHKAFEIISLFSEVGGFMGLLLGASILSVIEFIDYIAMLVAKKWKNGPKKMTHVKPIHAFK